MKLAWSVVEPSTCKKDLCPIIFLHTILDSRKTWKVVAPQIANDTERLVYCLDARNHGESPWTANFTLQFMVDDIKEFLCEQSISKAIFVGSSMGGSLAMKLALEAPELVEKFVVEDMVPKPYPKYGWKILFIAIGQLRNALAAVPDGSNPIAAKTAISNYLKIKLPFFYPNQNHEFGLEVMPLKEDDGSYKWEANLNGIKRALQQDNFDSGLTGKYDGDALFLYGTESQMNAGEDKDIPILFPRATCILVTGAGKMTHFELPKKFVKNVVEFINDEDVDVCS